MAKIKSTIDLVMERTKNLNMTDDDKQKLQTREVTDKVRSWLRKYLEGKINADKMRRNLEAYRETFPAAADILKKELVSSIKPEGDNKKVLKALARVFDISAEPIEELIASYKTQLGLKMPHYLEQLGSDLKEQGICGTSVVPNISRSKPWRDFILQEQEDLARRIIQFIDTGTSNS